MPKSRRAENAVTAQPAIISQNIIAVMINQTDVPNMGMVSQSAKAAMNSIELRPWFAMLIQSV